MNDLDFLNSLLPPGQQTLQITVPMVMDALHHTPDHAKLECVLFLKRVLIMNCEFDQAAAIRAIQNRVGDQLIAAKRSEAARKANATRKRNGRRDPFPKAKATKA
jgi:hypothetical protein